MACIEITVWSYARTRSDRRFGAVRDCDGTITMHGSHPRWVET